MYRIFLFLLILSNIVFAQLFPRSVQWWHISDAGKDSLLNYVLNSTLTTIHVLAPAASPSDGLKIEGQGSNRAANISFYSGDSARWRIGASGEADTNDFDIFRYADDGSFLDNPFKIERSTGNVGIGTTSIANPGAWSRILQVYGEAHSAISVRNSADQWDIGAASGGSLRFNDAGVGTRMTINSTGNVGIGTANPDSMITVEEGAHIKRDLLVDGNIETAGYMHSKNFTANIGDSVIAIGYRAGLNQTAEIGIFMGNAAGAQQEGENVLSIGTYSGAYGTGDTSIYIGVRAGLLGDGSRSIGIGNSALNGNVGDDVIGIGYEALYLNTKSNIFSLKQANVNDSPLIFGEFDTGNVGIGTANPKAQLSIGNNVATGGLDYFSEYQLLLYENSTAAESYGIGVKSGSMVFNTDIQYSFDQDGSPVAVINNGNVGIGTTTFNASAAKVLAIGNGTAPAAGTANQAYVYTVSGELTAMDAAGNPTTLTSHDDNRQWIYKSGNNKTGKFVYIEMQEMMRDLADVLGKITGKEYYYEFDLTTEQMKDFSNVMEELVKTRKEEKK